MSVFKRPGADTFSYDFWVDGRRFSGSTGATSKREALKARDREKAAATELMKKLAGRVRPPMSFEEAASRYWLEVGQHHKGGGDDNTLWSLDWLKSHIGGKRLIIDIDDGVVAKIVAERRGERTKDRKNTPGRPVSNATVNRSVTEPLRKILNRAARVWKEPIADISWRDHMLREPKERVREMKVEEEARLFEALRPDYHPIMRFAILTGVRIGEIVRLRWQDVDWGSRQITIHGKGGKIATVPMAPDVRELLWALRGQHPEHVFTYVVARNRVVTKGEESVTLMKGERRPITREGLKTAFRRILPTAQIENFRFHDNRHTAATRVLRAGGNLKTVQRLLRHENIATTTKYAHVSDEDVMAAMQAAAERAEAAKAELREREREAEVPPEKRRDAG